MRECPHCQGMNIDGTAFCEQCGASLSPQPAAPAPATASIVPPTPTEQVAATTINFVVTSPAGETCVGFSGQELLCGRRDERMRIFPDIALDDPVASRRHLA